MGCDIHLYVERLNNGVWEACDNWKVSKDEYDSGRKVVDYDSYFYKGRNYDLFSILANVRNGYGFAGVPTGEGFIPISMPRGVPGDCCKEYKDEVANWDCDGHSHSYITVAEIMSYDWTQRIGKTGIVDLKGLARWKTQGKPENWSGVISGQGIEIFEGKDYISEIEMFLKSLDKNWYSLNWPNEDATREAINNHLARITGVDKPHFRVNWGKYYYEAGSIFLSETLPKLWKLGKFEDVRILFFFDN